MYYLNSVKSLVTDRIIPFVQSQLPAGENQLNKIQQEVPVPPQTIPKQLQPYIQQPYSLPSKIQSRISQFYYILGQEEVNIEILKELSTKGIPEEVQGLRGLCWRLLLKIWPSKASKWKEAQIENEMIYKQFVQEFLTYQLDEEEEKDKCDHPLATNQDSHWNQRFKDLELWDEIEKDTSRTRAEIA